MVRDIFTNKWILGGCGFLIVFGIACYFWSQHELNLYKQEASPEKTDTDVPVSPHGFGPYPPLPPGWRGTLKEHGETVQTLK